ncbi:hypothetical protein BD779DRAFT_1797040 [Infundibulicybe gibba]|nr:hypothetical protein BD779DRAFT_1797040 [Infundibulicybe gibba]
MKRHTRGGIIRGDELEQHRIQLEHNLQHTDLSLHLSSSSSEDGQNHYNNNDSIEYPRHNSGPSNFPDFPSFDRSVDHFGGDSHSQLHAWSFGVGDEEEGINPYGGETMSTAAHHVSALTLSAGLGGGRGVRRDISISGAEYDPDRPLDAMISGVGSRFSVFDTEPSRSKYPGVGSITYDPLVIDVEDTAELDRVLESGLAPPPTAHARSVRLQSPHSSSSSASDSGSDQPNNPSVRPKLSDSLRRVSFSPKRPRTSPRSYSNNLPQSNANPRPTQPPPSPLARGGDATPRTSTLRRSNIFPSYKSPHPEVQVQPPTPSSAGSGFTRMARGLVHELEVEAEQEHGMANPFEGSKNSAPTPAPAAVSTVRNPTPRKSSIKAGRPFGSQQTPKGKVYLPDVTGLTSAAESPAKLGTDYYVYRADNSPRESEARLISTLTAVQTKLQELEEENSISRRRVRELEMELEVCKREVVRERTRVLEREEAIGRSQRSLRDLSMREDGVKRTKGKARARDVSVMVAPDNADLGERYREAVEEKKALEALIGTLRSHLTRLTSELSSHQQLLLELRNLRESDVRSLKEKSGEVDKLREQVERLAGEVEVLRGVVEEGLKERRAVREVSGEAEIEVHNSRADLGMSRDDDADEDGDNNLDFHVVDVSGQRSEAHEEPDTEEDDDDDEDNSEDAEPFDPQSIHGSSRANINPDRTMKTNATIGSSCLLSTPGTGAFLNTEELERISAEVEERRSNLSMSGMSSISQSRSRARASPTPSRSPSPTITQRLRPAIDVSTAMDTSRTAQRPASPAVLSPRPRFSQLRAPSPLVRPSASTSRPPAPTPAHQTRRAKQDAATPETPFPQIRGEHLERLFFSAPEHNAKTCTVCHRRPHFQDHDASWVPDRFKSKQKEDVSEAPEQDVSDEDEGFAEGSEEVEPEQRHGRDKGKQREHVTFATQLKEDAGKQGLPPQTVVARVIRELEDDFTHYKGIYVELADQYKEMDAASNVRKRNLLAQHLREVVDILEQKGDQIASLYDLLSFKDKPVSESILANKNRPAPAATSSWGRNKGLKRHPTAS